MEKQNNKVIHYIWYGGNPLSELTKKCIESWKKYLPDFEIKEWNESNFDTNQCPFIKEAYEQKKWAFVADYTRFKVLEEYGGMYLDTDMEVTKDVAEFLEKDLFLGVEDSKMINAAVVWAKEAHNPHIQDIVKIYESKKHFNESGDLYQESVPRVLTKYFGEFGFDGEKDEIQTFDDGKVWIYPMEYFYPKSYDYQNNRFTENSAMIHHFDATWISPMEKFKTKMKRQNMVWVVYVIDFFISAKNKIKFFANYRDLSIFFTMFTVLMMSYLARTKVGDVVCGATTQILVFSLLWTFITAKVRNIHVNKYMDKLLGRKESDVENGIIDNKPMNLTQTLAFQKREENVHLVQFILTILLSLCPILSLSVGVKNDTFIYSSLFALSTYITYLGINSKFRFRILEIIPYGIILGLLSALNFAMGFLTSLGFFTFMMFNLIKNEPKKKRIYFFAGSFILTLVVGLICFVCGENTLAFRANLGQDSIITKAQDYTVAEDTITELNYLKKFFNNGLQKMSCSSLNYIYLAITEVLVILLTIFGKNKNYIFIGGIILINAIGIATATIDFGVLTVMAFVVLLLMTVQKGIFKVSK